VLKGLGPADVDFIVVWSYNPYRDESRASAVTNRAGIDRSSIMRNVIGAQRASDRGFIVASDRIGDVATSL
jgi:hypothetical protein